MCKLEGGVMSCSRGSRYESRSPYRRSSYSRSVDSSDAENPGNNLYVTGLSARVTDRDLEKHFSTEGEVIDASVVHDPWTRESRGFGFVTMATVKEADRCIKYLDRSVLEGRVITVEKILNNRSLLLFNIKDTFLSSPLLHRQKEDEVERQHLGSILVRNHHVVTQCFSKGQRPELFLQFIATEKLLSKLFPGVRKISELLSEERA
ncbi:serine/arginine-rich splicing factor SR45a isoform X2 [Panicum miliaceum]|uniref:Serine/arginine-rich splicing factor SR45a isoform X2 n=1 Tax=Panicum miliaceum TaxID=4540 RepID=A0A3L6TIM4_PANMI|nr:serine/arginine-rich splicing factor SR45a isoform X2 [Panicum miliaceum]